MLCSLVFVVSALLEFAFVVLLSRAPINLKKNLPHGAIEKGTFSNVSSQFRSKIANKEGINSKWLQMEKEKIHDQKNIKIFADMPPIYVVDLYSFGIFIFLFVLFNCIYWTSYQV